jgi:hypothetical protein
MNQMDEAMHKTSKLVRLFFESVTQWAHEHFQDDSQFTSKGLQSTNSNPFSDSHEASSMLSDVPIGGLNQIDVEAYQSQVTGGMSTTIIQYL